MINCKTGLIDRYRAKGVDYVQPNAFVPLGGQVAYDRDELPSNGNEAVSQKWLAVIDKKSYLALTCINDGVYGSDYSNGEIRISLLRSVGYSGHPIEKRPIMEQDRYSSRIDQGERVYRFCFNAGKASERMEVIDREALALNEKPFVLSFFPSGAGDLPENAIILSDSTVLLTAFKTAVLSDDYIIRLFEPTGTARATTVSIPALGIKQELQLGKFEIKTLRSRR